MVCLGNICRSPIAEGLLRYKIRLHNLAIITDSAGTNGLHNGEAPDVRTQHNALKHKVDISDLRSRQITLNDLAQFDVIYTMDTNNYATVLAMCRTDVEKSKVKLILNELHPNSNQAVPDPYYGGADGFENVYQLLNKATDNIIAKYIAGTLL
ncbi:MAG: low molecular weight phosphotyrosine protein phosphatase [Bacteroidia bacterium]|nr:low molecular weight phosphotyrosine protein phosphatase [Bacteroidia bacterium]